jgi:hypothetical protein
MALPLCRRLGFFGAAAVAGDLGGGGGLAVVVHGVASAGQAGELLVQDRPVPEGIDRKRELYHW